MVTLTDAELLADLHAHREHIANRNTTQTCRMESIKAERAIQKELDRRAADRMRNQPTAPPVQPFDLDGFEKQNGWRRD